MKVKVRKFVDYATLPEYGSAFAAGADLYACLGDPHDDAFLCVIDPHKTAKIPTGITMEIPEGYFGAIFARSGLALKRGLRPCNCVGVIDSDYRGEIIVALHNDTNVQQDVMNGERIAQIVILPYVQAEFVEAEWLSDTERGSGGFGSTGTTDIRSGAAS